MRGHRTLSSLARVGCGICFTLGVSFSAVRAEIDGRNLLLNRSPGQQGAAPAQGAGRVGLEPVPNYYRALTFLHDHYLGALGSDAALTYAAIRGMLRPLDDPFTRFLEPRQYRALKEQNQGGYVGVGALLDPHRTRDGYLRVHSLAPGAWADSVGLKPLDVILKVEGISTQRLNPAQVSRMLAGRAAGPVRLIVRRNARSVALTIHPQWVERSIVECELREGQVGVIRLFEFNDRSDAQIDQALTRLERQGMRALILDLRGNPGGTLDAAQEVASRFLPAGKNIVTILANGLDPEIRPVLEREHNHRLNQRGHAIPLVVLVNRTSASAAEIVAGAIQDHRAGVIMGTRTYGKGLVQTVVPLRGGAAVAITSARYLTPNGVDLNRGKDQRGGITPDVVVEATEEDWLKRNDVQFKTALRLLHERIGYRRPSPHAAHMSRR
jgi:carboxyl-terminal processing protease